MSAALKFRCKENVYKLLCKANAHNPCAKAEAICIVMSARVFSAEIIAARCGSDALNLICSH
jgi:hypothetical protein